MSKQNAKNKGRKEPKLAKNVALNAFITFLSLRDMNIIKQEDLNDLSQAIFTQIQSIAISSI